MTIPTFKARGNAGSWFAQANDGRLPCVHNWWRMKQDQNQYEDSTVRWQNPKWHRFFAAIRDGKRVIETTSSMPQGVDGPWRRNGYIGIFTVEDVTFDGTTLRFRYVERVADLF